MLPSSVVGGRVPKCESVGCGEIRARGRSGFSPPLRVMFAGDEWNESHPFYSRPLWLQVPSSKTDGAAPSDPFPSAGTVDAFGAIVTGSSGDGDSGFTYLRRRVNAAEAALRGRGLIATSRDRERLALAESEAKIMRLSWELEQERTGMGRVRQQQDRYYSNHLARAAEWDQERLRLNQRVKQAEQVADVEKKKASDAQQVSNQFKLRDYPKGLGPSRLQVAFRKGVRGALPVCRHRVTSSGCEEVK